MHKNDRDRNYKNGLSVWFDKKYKKKGFAIIPSHKKTFKYIEQIVKNIGDEWYLNFCFDFKLSFHIVSL